MAALLASVDVTNPLGHRLHGTVDTELYFPAAHAVHVVAPLPDKLSVTEPGAHATHADVDWALYSPATHAVQLTAPADANVSVVAPAAHAKHCDCPAWPWYCPATQSVHACVDAALERPAAQALHVVAPTLANVSVTDPGAHAVHADVDTGLLDGKPTCRAVPPTDSCLAAPASCHRVRRFTNSELRSQKLEVQVQLYEL